MQTLALSEEALAHFRLQIKKSAERSTSMLTVKLTESRHELG